MMYIVLGMHKSGTTMISQILHKSGIYMGEFDETISYYEGQQYENSEFHEIICDILNCGELHSLNTIKIPKEIDENKLREFQNLINKYNSKFSQWGFKNPRTILIYDKIKHVLPEHKLVCVYRNLEDVSLHYFKHSFSNFFKSIRAWVIYNEELIKILQSRKTGYFLINYNEFLTNNYYWQNLNEFLQIKLKDVRDVNIKKKKRKISEKIFIKFFLIFGGLFYKRKIKMVDKNLEKLKS